MGFTHVDPFEDTERLLPAAQAGERRERFTHVDPFEDTERRKVGQFRATSTGFTHVDPFEDTERA